MSKVTEKHQEVQNTSTCSVCEIPYNEASASLRFFDYLWSRSETKISLLALLLILPGLIYHEILHIPSVPADISSIAAMLLAGIPVFRSAWHSLTTTHEININVLMSIAAVGAVIIGVYTEAAMVMVLFALSEAIEGYTIEKSRESIRSLISIVPRRATLMQTTKDRSIQETKVELDSLAIGDTILVKPGEQIPMDGIVVEGYSNVNQAPITGESALIEKSAGAEVFASTMNGEGALTIEVTRLAADNTISRMIALVEEAQEKRTPTQQFINRFARYYTPAIVLISFAVAAIPPLLFQQPFLDPSAETHGWLYRGLSLLVVGCPCALVISTPVSIISAISNAYRHGILIKGGIYLEKLSQIRVFAFDKTGTLTAGRPSVIETRSLLCETVYQDETHASLARKQHSIRACPGCSEMIALASAVERHSEHPVAHAITQEASLQQLDTLYPAADSTRAITGRGVTGNIQNRNITIGSHQFFKDIPHPKVHCDAAHLDSKHGYTPVMVESDGEYVGTITVADQVRSSSREALTRLKDMGFKTLVMITGDIQQTASVIAQKVGITDIFAGLLPEDKVKTIQEIRQVHGAVAMVGDGINDAPALASADIGIAIGGSGATTQAMETADITLMSGDLSQLPHAVRLSHKTMQTIRFNVIFILMVKLAFILLVSSGLGTMWMAVLADTGLTLLVTLNSMRLLIFEKGVS